MDVIHIGSLTLYPFGVFMAPLILLSLIIVSSNMKKAGLKKSTASWFALLALPLCFCFSRIGYCVFVVDQIIGDQDYTFIFRLNEGGFLLWGAILGGIIAAFITGKLTHQPAWKILDSTAVAACLLIAAGRIVCGLILKNQGIGFAVSDWFNSDWADPEEADFSNRFSLFLLEDYSCFERLPFAVKNSYGTYCWAVFILEAVWAVITAVKVNKSRRLLGRKFMLFIVMYASGQILLESMLRGEVLHLPWLGFVKANMVLSAVAILVVMIICICQMEKNLRPRNIFISALMTVFSVLIIIAMEFAVFEKKISLIESWPSDVCHLIMAFGCTWLAVTVCRLFRYYPKYNNKTYENLLT